MLCLFLVGCKIDSKIELNERLESINQIELVQLQTKLKKDNFVLYIGRDNCRDCQEFKPILAEYLKMHKGVYIYYLDVKEIKKKPKDYEYLKKELGFNWTPSIIHYKNKKIVDKFQYLDSEYYQLNDIKKKQVKKEYISKFNKWMKNQFK